MIEFKLLVAGGREFNDYSLLNQEIIKISKELNANRKVSLSIVSGMARGADALGVRFARQYDLTLYEFPADWDRHGRSAGYIRNVEMEKACDGALIFWDGSSRGTKHMINLMSKTNKPFKVIRY